MCLDMVIDCCGGVLEQESKTGGLVYLSNLSASLALTLYKDINSPQISLLCLMDRTVFYSVSLSPTQESKTEMPVQKPSMSNVSISSRSLESTATVLFNSIMLQAMNSDISRHVPS